MERTRAALSLGWLLAACTASEGALFIQRADAGMMSAPDGASAGLDASSDLDGPDANRGMPPNASGGRRPVRHGMKLQYQLSGALDETADAELFVVDLFEASRAQIEALHASGKTVVAFVAAGSLEPWRPDIDELPPSAIGAPLVGYPDEAWLDVRAPSVRQLLVGRITLAAEKGFDGVLLVSLDAYLADSGHALSAADQLAYNIWLAQEAAQQGLAAGISSDWPHAAELAPHYGFAIHFNCVADQRCSELDPYRARGRAVFDLETAADDPSSLCAAASRMDLPVTLKRSSFDAWSMPCP